MGGVTNDVVNPGDFTEGGGEYRGSGGDLEERAENRGKNF